MNVKPSKSPWWMALTTSDCIGVNSAFSEIKSTSKFLKSRLDLCMCVVGEEEGGGGERTERRRGKERGGKDRGGEEEERREDEEEKEEEGEEKVEG